MSGQVRNKEDLGRALHERELVKSKAEGVRIVDALLEEVAKELKEGNTIKLFQYLSLKPITRAAREGRNVATGEKIQIPAKRAVKFVAHKQLKDLD